MRSLSRSVPIAGLLLTSAGCALISLYSIVKLQARSQLAAITVDYPGDRTLFPPDIAAPTFLWRDAEHAATVWRIDIAFGGRAADIRLASNGERLRIGEVDERCAKAGAVPPALTPNEAAGHSWKPDAATWATILKRSMKRPATVTFTGFRDRGSGEPSPADRSPFRLPEIPWARRSSSATCRSSRFPWARKA